MKQIYLARKLIKNGKVYSSLAHAVLWSEMYEKTGIAGYDSGH